MKNHTITKQLICLVLAILTVSFSSCHNTPKSTENPNINISSEPITETDALSTIKTWDEFRGDDYTIKKDGEKWYMIFDDPSLYDSSTGDTSVYLQFSSIEEWVEKVMKGKLTESEKHHIYKVFNDFKKGPIVCDFNNLYTPKLPNNLTFKGINWLSSSYSFDIFDKNGENQKGCITFHPLYSYDKAKADYENNEPSESSEKSDDRNATIYYIGSMDTLYYKKIIRYTLKKGEQTIYVEEEYILNANVSEVTVSSTVPKNISMFTSNGEYYIECSLNNFTQRPSVAWLSQFAAEHYVNTAYEGE